MKANITLKIDANLLREAKIMAAKEDSSISALLSQQIETLVRQRNGYEAARRRALARLQNGWNLGWAPPFSREGLHER
jgi:hypothetical protein